MSYSHSGVTGVLCMPTYVFVKPKAPVGFVGLTYQWGKNHGPHQITCWNGMSCHVMLSCTYHMIVAAELNRSVENIGARRLNTIIERYVRLYFAMVMLCYGLEM